MGYLDDIGARIKVRMKREHTNAKELARNLDMSENTLGRIVQGKGVAGIDKIIDIAEILNVSTDWLIYGKDGYGRNEFGDLPTKEAIEKVIRQNHTDLSPVPPGQGKTLKQIIRAVQKLSPEDQKKILKIIKALQ